MDLNERPGAQTPWIAVNQLLDRDERFEVKRPGWQGFLLAPKYSTQLSALLYLLHQECIPFSIEGRGTKSCPASHFPLVLSARAFSQLVLHEQGVIEVGAGCPLSHFHQFLFERKREVALEEDPLSSSRGSIGGLLLSGRTAGLSYRGESISESIIGVELVTLEGSQIQWGSCQRSAVAGPSLHKLIFGLESIPAVIVKILLKTFPIPRSRVHLSWSFRQKEVLWEQFHLLRNFTSTWEYLDCVLSGKLTDRGFIFAQISGLPEEMKAFSLLCPAYSSALQGGEKLQLKQFMKKEKLKAYSSTIDRCLEEGEYLWHQDVNQKTWWMTPQILNRGHVEEPLWKRYLWKSLKNE